MIKTSRFTRTDLAAELRESAGEELPGVRSETEEREGVSLVRVYIESEDAAKKIGKPRGVYVTLSFGKPWLMSEEEEKTAAELLGRELRTMMTRKGVAFARGPVLAAGLGNRRMTSDSIGPAALSKITVTRHIERIDKELFARLRQRSVAAICPGVLGDTGVESAETLAAISRAISPCALILVDALAARSAERLVCTVQLGDAGISPGAGVGNDRPQLDEALFGVPVFSVGVPTVVDASTLLYGLLENAGMDEKSLPQRLETALENGRELFVSPKEIDAAVEILSDILAKGIDLALSIGG